ncbi:MAG TPA: GntR family transcriptional regulator [Ktedonobacterales bacterium]|jgi:GntR family transcriptional regulator
MVVDVIHRNSPIPIYHQLKEILLKQIRTGAWPPGALIPSERELCDTYGISRMTARQAITDLVNEGVCYREQGRGTFVSPSKIHQQLQHLSGFTEDIRARGQLPSTQVLAAAMLPANETTATRLRVPVDTPVFCLERLRLANDQPLAVERTHILFKGCERLVEEDFAHHSLYRTLEASFGVALVEADQELEAGLASAEDAQLLQIAVGSAVLYTRRTTYGERNQPIEYARSVYCGNKYVFYTHLKREQLFNDRLAGAPLAE